MSATTDVSDRWTGRTELTVEEANEYEDGSDAVQFHDSYRGRDQSRVSGELTEEDGRLIITEANGRVPPGMKPRYFSDGYEETDPVPEDLPTDGCLILEVGPHHLHYAYAQTRDEAEEWI